MPWAEFGESQYRDAALVEMAFDTRVFHSPTQNLEKIFGYDHAFLMGLNDVWNILGVAMPRGVFLVPNFWHGVTTVPTPIKSTMPKHRVSLILQYKRPFLVKRKYDRRAWIWDAFCGQYYRIELDDPPQQFEILHRLEMNLNERAVVRYAAPVFSEYEVLMKHMEDRTILENSNFVSPYVISPGHTAWAYTEAGNEGIANPEEARFECETFEAMVMKAKMHAREETIYAHLVGMAESLRIPSISNTDDIPNWIKVLKDIRIEFPEGVYRHSIELESEVIKALYYFAEICKVIGSSGASWWTLEF